MKTPPFVPACTQITFGLYLYGMMRQEEDMIFCNNNDETDEFMFQRSFYKSQMIQILVVISNHVDHSIHSGPSFCTRAYNGPFQSDTNRQILNFFL